MMIFYIAIFAIDAFHIFLLMRFCRNCIGAYRINKKIASIVFVAYWIISCYIRLLPFSKRFSAANFTLFVIEIVFLLAISFFYRGKILSRFAVAFILPLLYWGVEGVSSKALFNAFFVSNEQCLLCTGIAIALFLFLELVLEKVKKSKSEQEREFLEQEVRMYEKQFDVIRQSQKNIHSLKHDMKHHVKMLSDLVSSDDKNAALAYLSDMVSFMENGEEYVSSGNERIDSILNYMISKAMSAKVNTNWKIQIPEHLDISTFDINVILSNLLENALNALAKVSDPSLHILMKYDRGVLCIDIQNNCIEQEQAASRPNQLLEPIGEHGYGLKNVRRIVEKYHGSLITDSTNGIFSASVLLFMTDVIQV